jgi:hypothetical protein
MYRNLLQVPLVEGCHKDLLPNPVYFAVYNLPWSDACTSDVVYKVVYKVPK